jgi:hypothetical protein
MKVIWEKLYVWAAQVRQSHNWPLIASALFTGVLLGLLISDVSRDVKLDGGWATLLGSALGAAITVGGGLWTAAYLIRAGERSSKEFAGQVVAGVWDEARMLIGVAEKTDFETNRVNADAMMKQFEALTDVIGLFKANEALRRVQNYEVQRGVSALEKEIIDSMKVVDWERQWLSGTATNAVLENSRPKLASIGTDICTACVGVMRELGYTHSPMSDEESARRIARLAS